MTLITGMSISGKISFGVRKMDRSPRTTIRTDITTKVYGRRRARRTIHICVGWLDVSRLRLTRGDSASARLERSPSPGGLQRGPEKRDAGMAFPTLGFRRP